MPTPYTNASFPPLKLLTLSCRRFTSTEWNAHQDAGRPFKEGIEELSSEFPQYAELIQAYDTYWEESITETLDGTIEICTALKNAGWNLYLLSNFSVEKFSLMQKQL